MICICFPFFEEYYFLISSFLSIFFFFSVLLSFPDKHYKYNNTIHTEGSGLTNEKKNQKNYIVNSVLKNKVTKKVMNIFKR